MYYGWVVAACYLAAAVVFGSTYSSGVITGVGTRLIDVVACATASRSNDALFDALLERLGGRFSMESIS